ncbi:MAG: hypothetical protein IJ682_00505 [Lachnospiraceae bacterium]|nr:hypothetical protein [Lachnospiraceae bacterium]
MSTTLEFKHELRHQLRELNAVIALLENGQTDDALNQLREMRDMVQESLND